MNSSSTALARKYVQVHYEWPKQDVSDIGQSAVVAVSWSSRRDRRAGRATKTIGIRYCYSSSRLGTVIVVVGPSTPLTYPLYPLSSMSCPPDDWVGVYLIA